MEHKDRQEIEKPERIYVETEDYDPGHEFGGFQKEFKSSYQRIGARSYPVSVRIACLFLTLFLLFFLLLATPFVLLFFGVNVLTFFQWNTLWQRTKIVWSTYSKMIVTAFGLLVGIFSPALGLSIIVVYLMMQGQKSSNTWVERIFKASKKRQGR